MDFAALTTRYEGRVRVLACDVVVAPPLGGPNVTPSKTLQCVGLWDTGATGTVITDQVAKELGLEPITYTQVHTANGSGESPVYLVALRLPNRVVVDVQATVGKLVGCDVLIGMDVIGAGDFAVTNVKGKTVLSYRVPSCEEIDYVREAAEIRAGLRQPPTAADSRWERRHPNKPRPQKRKRRKR